MVRLSGGLLTVTIPTEPFWATLLESNQNRVYTYQSSVSEQNRTALLVPHGGYGPPVLLDWIHLRHMCAPASLSHHRSVSYMPFDVSLSYGSFQRGGAGRYRPTQASGCTEGSDPAFLCLISAPIAELWHTGAGHSCHRFRLYDRRAPHSFPVPRRSQQSGVVSFHRQLLVLWSNLRARYLIFPARITVSVILTATSCRIGGATLSGPNMGW